MRAKIRKLLTDYLCPNLYVESVVEIDLTLFYNQGYRSILFDLDNTLLGWRSQEIPAKVIEWVNNAKLTGYKMLILSNSLRGRVHRLSKTIPLPAIAVAGKPRKKVFREALKMLEASAKETIVIGDQLFTDVLGAKRNGMYSILVVPVDQKELFVTEFVRIPERFVMRYFIKEGLIRKGSAF